MHHLIRVAIGLKMLTKISIKLGNEFIPLYDIVSAIIELRINDIGNKRCVTIYF